MVAGGQGSDGCGEITAEGSAICRGAKTDDGIDGESRESSARYVSAVEKAFDFADDAGGEGDEVAGGKPVGAALRVGSDRAHGGGRNDVGGGGGDEDAFGEAAPLAFLGNAYKVVSFEGAEVVVDFLAADAEPGGEAGGGGRFCQFREEAAAHRFECDNGGGGIVDDLYFEEGKGGGHEDD